MQEWTLHASLSVIIYLHFFNSDLLRKKEAHTFKAASALLFCTCVVNTSMHAAKHSLSGFAGGATWQGQTQGVMGNTHIASAEAKTTAAVAAAAVTAARQQL
jgi:hypothetical protein